ncbi:hypothetical protein [Butyrivibrio proteoclasticus]|uniref:hypothetical protein n=1 Tax=Butyrivibrio proteoclasticus TaxID=43305 RepID=UPI001A9A417D|nr:hypothetical protein [Butyrivibrio proteoclasticus]
MDFRDKIPGLFEKKHKKRTSWLLTTRFQMLNLYIRFVSQENRLLLDLLLSSSMLQTFLFEQILKTKFLLPLLEIAWNISGKSHKYYTELIKQKYEQNVSFKTTPPVMA